ncbi:MAG: hypothetical protein ACRELY_00785, partial [Polyangiaceae bacterium]
SLIVGTSAWLGCGSKGDTGPAGAAGATGASGAGTAGPTGPSGSAGSAGAAGPTGPTGPANTTWWRGGVVTPGADETTPNTFDAGTWGPFNLSGHCFFTGNPGEVEAEVYASSTDPNAKYTDYGSASDYVENGSFPPDGGATPVGYESVATPPDSYFDGPYDGTFSALSSDLKTYITGGFSTGVNVGGDAGTACQFGGYMTQPP